MSNLAARILSSLVLLPPLILSIFYAPSWVFLCVVVCCAALCGGEFGSFALEPPFKTLRAGIAFFSAFVAACVSVWPFFQWSLLLLPSVLPIVVSVLFLVSKSKPRQAAVSLAISIAGSLYIGGLMGFVGLLFVSHENGGVWVLALLAAAFLGDTGAYAAGRAFGRHKLSPIISPNKTWEGAIGGWAGTSLSIAVFKVWFLTDLDWLAVVGLSAILSVACQIGDLTESLFKRGFGVKDSGRIIPGHGGMLDRIDALMFGAPVLFFFSILR
ncbi:MAG: phosphatidate cytidylyltransferase [Myxococcota bacterium]|nr:phosphatidate cytidylyltransferase [Myxococcota bacterium]